ncbi:GNAT family N-acetyltransferase [Eubacterium sp. An3]|uniref:GNAT family N-acetyltransferase n=1 Tax=Eubacterium sp. An3 TaxID=1965628 RepID=UPI00194EA3D5|nr:GNAT family N-acetyltransferase [Eubacterium sp. An3]
MIRQFVPEDLDEVMQIWLKTNQEAHNFISTDYWSSHYDMVKEMLPQAEIYVYEKDEKNAGTAGEGNERDAADICESDTCGADTCESDTCESDTCGADIRRLAGFIGLTGDYIAGIFVEAEEQSRGVGKQLLVRAKQDRKRLTLQAYEKNERAVHFYQREGFRVVYRDVDEGTGEAEYVMEWKR